MINGWWFLALILFVSLLLFSPLFFAPNAGFNKVGEEQLTDEKIENVARILVHSITEEKNECSRSEFTLLVQEPNTAELKPLKVYTDSCKIFKDVPQDKPMWAIKGNLIKIKHNDPKYDYIKVGYLELHIRSEKNLEGAGWKYSYYDSNNKRTVTKTGYTHVLCCD